MDNIKYGIAWQDSYKLDDEMVDSQHRRLFELVSELVGSCLDGSNEKKLRETLDFLVEYTVQHFYDEESLQVQYNYPDYKRHKQLHEDFKVTVGGIVRKFEEEGSSVELSNDANKIVVRWLIYHITLEDKKVGRHLKSCRERQF